MLAQAVSYDAARRGGEDWTEPFGVPEEYYEARLHQAYYHIADIVNYGGEEEILRGDWLSWNATVDEDGMYQYELIEKYGFRDIPTVLIRRGIPAGEDDPELKRHWTDAVNARLSAFRLAVEWLEEERANGLGWYASIPKESGGIIESGDARMADFVPGDNSTCLVHDNGETEILIEGKFSERFFSDYYYGNAAKIRISYTPGEVARVLALRGAQFNGFVRAVVLCGIMTLLALALLIPLVSGAGNRPNADGQTEKTPLYTLWLDVILVICVFAGAGIVGLIYAMTSEHYTFFLDIAHAGNALSLYVFTAAVAVLFSAIVTGTVLCIARRVKAGRWWRHTLLHTIWRGIRHIARRLWAGLPLGLQVLAVAAALCVQLIMLALSYDAGLLLLVFMMFDVVCLLLFAVNLSMLQRGAKRAAGGDTPNFPALLGVFSRLAGYIGAISQSVGAAVEARIKSERMKTELITNVSHDIRTPITGLIAYTDLLNTEGLESERAGEYLAVITQKAQRLKTLTDDLFEASKAASGNITVQPETLDLCQLVRQVLGEMDERISQSGLDIREGLPERALVRADGKLMWRVIENLLDNTLKYALGGSRVYITLEEKETLTRLYIKNVSEMPLGNIAPEELTERFKRGDEARAGEGAGLGLSIVQSFMTAQGGDFAVEIDGDLFKACVTLGKS
jgi:signal transduction histidine kinase